jgi:lipoprotein-releasing system permease protein
MQKARDIAILKALGATDGVIRRIFVMNGLLIGAIGVVMGAALGAGLCRLLASSDLIRLPGDLFYITRLPIHLLPADVLAIGLAAMGICLLATLYPAHQAARLNPVETIRHG